MFSLHQRGNSRAAEAHTDFHPEHSNGPLDGELADLYVAILIVVPLALLLKSLFFWSAAAVLSLSSDDPPSSLRPSADVLSVE